MAPKPTVQPVTSKECYTVVTLSKACRKGWGAKLDFIHPQLAMIFAKLDVRVKQLISATNINAQ